MLADDWAEMLKKPGVTDLHEGALQTALDEAARFKVDFDLVDEILLLGAERPVSFLAARGLARLPYKTVWAEFPMEAKWGISFGHEGSLLELDRVGFLYNERVGSKEWVVSAFCEGGGRFFSMPSVYTFDPNADVYVPPHEVSGFMRATGWRGAYAEAEAALKLFPEDWCRANAYIDRNPAVLRSEALKSRGAWSKLAVAAIGIVALINGGSSCEVEEVEPAAKLQRARAKRGKLPLYEHKVLRLPVVARQDRAAYEASGGGKNRSHAVRGHFKVRKTGVFWWRPHRRGDEALGVVEKDYEVAAR